MAGRGIAALTVWEEGPLNAMPLDEKLQQRLERVLMRVDDHDTRGARLVDDARRLWARVRTLLKMRLLPGEIDSDPLQLACYALQLPARQVRPAPAGRLARTNLRDRAEQAAEMLVSELTEWGVHVDEALLDRTIQVLHEVPQRTPMLDEARLLADAVNLEDFGMIGLLLQTIQVCRQGGGTAQVADGLEKREQYGYWNARLKEGFHFEPVRKIAAARLEHSRTAAALLESELKDDGLA